MLLGAGAIATVAAKRYGLPLAIATGFIAWQLSTFAALVGARVMGVNPGYGVTVAGLAVAAVAITLERRIHPSTQITVIPIAAIYASLAGGAIWLVSLLLGFLSPRGAGLTWATYKDSAFDIFGMRMIIWSGGQTPAGGNPRPLEHVMSASFLPANHVVDASPPSLREQLIAHAAHWSTLIVVACLLAGIMSVLLAVRAGLHGTRVVVVAATVSIGMLLTPITGLIIDFGQINGHLVVVYILLSALVAYEASRAPLAASAILILLTACVAICWTPFAALPGSLAILTIFRFRATLLARRDRSVIILGASTMVFSWLVSAYALPDILRVLSRDAATNQASVTTTTISGFTNPYWWPLSIAVAVTTVLISLVLRAADKSLARTSIAVAVGLTLGMAPLLMARGNVLGPLEYYPAKYLSLATIGLAPVAIALALCATGPRVSRTGRTLTAMAALTAAILCVVAPLPKETPRLGLAPFDIATGSRWGSHQDVAGRALDLTTNDSRTVLWRSADSFEEPVNLLLAAIDREQYEWRTLSRAAIRAPASPGSADDACMAALTPGWTLTLVTRDAMLADEIEGRCPHLPITVRIEDATN